MDVSKGDNVEPNIRSRLVARKIRQSGKDAMSAPTPPLEAMKLLISHCTKSQQGSRPHRLVTIDIKRAYFYAPAQREVYIKLPQEDMLPGVEDMVVASG